MHIWNLSITLKKKKPKTNKYQPKFENSESIDQHTMSASSPMVIDEVLGVSNSST
jgi:hypothetical protein